MLPVDLVPPALIQHYVVKDGGKEGDACSREPWPPSVAPHAVVWARAMSGAERAMKAAFATPCTSARSTHLASGWSPQASFAVHATCGSVFVKVTRNFEEEGLDALEAESRAAQWAFDQGFGPAPLLFDRTTGVFVTQFLSGGVITAKEALQRLGDVVELLRRFHEAPVGPWQAPRFDPIATAFAQLEETLASADVSSTDKECIARATQRAATQLRQAQSFEAVPCHTDFHVQNIVKDEHGDLFVVDCEEAGLSDPMWDLGTLTANLATMAPAAPIAPLALASLYRVTPAQALRLRSHVELALAMYAGWTAVHGRSWQQQYAASLLQLRRLERAEG